MRRHELLGCLYAEALGEHRTDRLDLHLTEAGQCLQVGMQLAGVGGVRPDPRGIAVILVANMHGELVHPLGHRARKAVHGRFLAERRLEVSLGQRGGVDRAEPLAAARAARRKAFCTETCWSSANPNQQCHRVGGDQCVGLVGLGEVQAVRPPLDPSQASRRYSPGDDDAEVLRVDPAGLALAERGGTCGETPIAVSRKWASRMFARCPGEAIQAATIARGVARLRVPQPMFSPIS